MLSPLINHASPFYMLKNAGFKMMVAAAKKLKLKFEDVYLPGFDSPDGTWKGIIEAHSYEFVFLCFMNAFAKQVDAKLAPISMHSPFVI